MRKLFKKLFNRTTLVILILLIELAGLITAMYFAHETSNPNSPFYNPNLYWLATLDDLIILILLVMQVIIFFRVIYRQMDAEFKIPWIIVLLVLPLIGAVLYIFFGHKNLKGKDARLLGASDGLGAKFFTNKPDPKVYDEFHKTFDYLDNNSILCSHINNHVEYFRNGESFFPKFIQELENARDFIFLEFFIIGDGEEWQKVRKILIEKASQNVDVRVLYDDFGSTGVLKGSELKNLRKAGVKAYLFNPVKPIISGIYNNRDHRKIAVIDHRIAFTGGMNLADEYANIDSPFGYWKDTMISIEGSAINNLIQLFLTNYDLATKRTSNHAKFLDYDYPKFKESGVVFPFGHGPAPYFKERVGEETLVNIVNSAQKTLYISSPYFIPSESLLYSIRRAAINGVDVKLFLPGIPDKAIPYHIAQTYFASLLAAGVHIMIYRPGFNHMKTLLADGKLAFVGTINCDYRSLVHHFECGAVLYNVPCLKDVEADFKDMMIESEEVPQSFSMPKLRIFLCALVKPFASLF